MSSKYGKLFSDSFSLAIKYTEGTAAESAAINNLCRIGRRASRWASSLCLQYVGVRFAPWEFPACRYGASKAVRCVAATFGLAEGEERIDLLAFRRRIYGEFTWSLAVLMEDGERGDYLAVLPCGYRPAKDIRDPEKIIRGLLVACAGWTC